MHLLVVEDDDTIRRLLVEYLKQRALVEVDGARDGIEALHLLKRKEYAVIVLDLLMPGMNGADLIDSLKTEVEASPEKHPPALLVITAVSEADVPTMSLSRRAPQLVRGVFRKPLDFASLAHAVDEQLATTH